MKLSIVSYLDDESFHVIRKLQRELSEVTGSTECLTSWFPHVTIGDGVEVDDDALMELSGAIYDCGATNEAFEYEVTGFGGLDNRPIGVGEISTPYVLWANVVVSPELLSLVKSIEQITSVYSKWYRMPKSYSPHVTLAFRDLSHEGYSRGAEFLKSKEIKMKIMVDSISLTEKLEDCDLEISRFMLKV